jgi:succinate-semialdehyde dehydrogenase/glutarate-semialdehyde dehydrogenase
MWLLLKHSSNVPQCASVIQEIFVDAGMQDDIFKNSPIGSPKVAELIKDERVAAISFTGSSAAGCSTAELAGSCLKKTVLELGGSDSFIVFDDADLKYTTDLAVKARMINNGQSYIAAKRFIITKDVFEEFEEKITHIVERLVVGNPLDMSTDIGPLARLDIVKQLDEQVKKSIDKGAIVLTTPSN